LAAVVILIVKFNRTKNSSLDYNLSEYYFSENILERGWRVDKETLVIRSGESDKISCTLNSNSVDVQWRSEDSKIAEVNENGIVRAIQGGITYINAFYNNEKVISVPLYVDRPALPPLAEIEPSRFKLKSGAYTNPNAQKTNLGGNISELLTEFIPVH
jgi:hypothetical protein